MDSIELEWYLKHDQVEKLKQWKGEHDGVVCEHYLLKSKREGAYGEIAITDVYITLPDGKTYCSMKLWLTQAFEIGKHDCCKVPKS